MWPPHTKQLHFWRLSCFSLPIAPVVTFICTKAGETDSQSLPKRTD